MKFAIFAILAACVLSKKTHQHVDNNHINETAQQANNTEANHRKIYAKGINTHLIQSLALTQNVIYPPEYIDNIRRIYEHEVHDIVKAKFQGRVATDSEISTEVINQVNLLKRLNQAQLQQKFTQLLNESNIHPRKNLTRSANVSSQLNNSTWTSTSTSNLNRSYPNFNTTSSQNNTTYNPNISGPNFNPNFNPNRNTTYNPNFNSSSNSNPNFRPTKRS